MQEPGLPQLNSATRISFPIPPPVWNDNDYDDEKKNVKQESGSVGKNDEKPRFLLPNQPLLLVSQHTSTCGVNCLPSLALKWEEWEPCTLASFHSSELCSMHHHHRPGGRMGHQSTSSFAQGKDVRSDRPSSLNSKNSILYHTADTCSAAYQPTLLLGESSPG